MKESRQQRRARERAEAKAATRPGPTPPPEPDVPRPARPIGTITSDDVVEASLTRMVENDPEESTVEPDDPGIFWHTEWALRDGFWSVDCDGDEDLEAAVRKVVAHIWESSPGPGVPIEWDVDGDLVDGESPAATVTASGVTLPTST